MLRVFNPRGFNELRQRVLVAVSGARMFPRLFSSEGEPPLKTTARLIPAEKTEKIDVDSWKSVMKANTAPVEPREVTEERDENDSTKDVDALEAARNLVSLWRLAGKCMPNEITEEQMQFFSECKTKSSRTKYLKFLEVRESRKDAQKKKKEIKKEARAALLELNPEAEDSSAQNRIVHGFGPKYEMHCNTWKYLRAMKFGQPLVYDLSYDGHMNHIEMNNAVSQLLDTESFNRNSSDPFDLHFCNLHPEGEYLKQLVQRYGADAWSKQTVTPHAESYLDIFPRENLVYLTCDSHTVLHQFDHSKIYIIGALVDRTPRPGLSNSIAKRLNLATARLPLEHYLKWESGVKNLTLDQMMRIMVTIKDTGKWEEALKHVPTRKHGGMREKARLPLKYDTYVASSKRFKEPKSRKTDFLDTLRNMRDSKAIGKKRLGGRSDEK